jgi:hypothetical protein
MHGSDHGLAPRAMPDGSGDLPDRGLDRGEAVVERQIDHRHAALLERCQRVAGDEGRTDHEVGAERQYLLGGAVGGGQPPRTPGIIGHVRIARPFGERSDLPRIGERQQILVRAEIERHDPARRRGPAGGGQQRQQSGKQQQGQAEHGAGLPQS